MALVRLRDWRSKGLARRAPGCQSLEANTSSTSVRGSPVGCLPGRGCGHIFATDLSLPGHCTTARCKMPSLAKKSMNFIRDVYTAASNPDRPLLQPQGFQPTTGLSTQFIQPNIPYAQTPSSPYLQPYPGQGQYQQPQGVQTPYSSPYHGQPPTSSNNAWSAPLSSHAPPHTPSPTTPLVHNTYLNHPYNAISPNAPSGQYQPYGVQQPISGQHMFIPPKPPLPPRQQSQPWQNAESLPVTPAVPSATPPYSPPPPPHSAPPSVATGHSNTDRFQHLAELPATRPVPPPLPQRSPTQQVRPELLHEAHPTVRPQM